ncbi:iron-sulfur cluster co-chaperone protein HscB [Sitophilus oryzae]|uniref:Iron-sulfur cluster co-chaperone protein HscB n=1 Tax=Sitophilus oryzae TaxID=7048 RepID=A0A6J2Y1B2_SITOR|nr:iron-sulfur cluster co-chaperone protein HscB [Sitophilus oryzae]XP_030757563.1 iron-sulfur cluster co-chaperone protein HscB [Sitophilus oryzae]
MSFLIVARQIKNILRSQPEAKYHTIINKYKLRNIPYNLLIKYASQGYNQKVCWKCGIERKNFSDIFCSQCNVIQMPSERDNYFKLFDIDEQFDIDSKILKDKYKNLQNNLHPDRFINRTEEEKKISENYSSLVNKAYKCLATPLKRAEHLLKLSGSSIEEKQSSVDPGFLMEMMELNEELDNNVEPEQLRQLNIKNKNELERLAQSIDECFKHQNLDEAKQFVIKMQYYTSLGNRINAKLRELGVVD